MLGWCQAVVGSQQACTDGSVLKRLAGGVLGIVHLLSPGSPLEELEALAAEWVQMFFLNVAGGTLESQVDDPVQAR